MKPKHQKVMNSARRKRPQSDQRLSQSLNVPLDEITIEIDKYEIEDHDDSESLSKSFTIKCSTKISLQPDPKLMQTLLDEDEEDDDSESETERYNALFQSVRERRDQLVERLRVYNNLFKFHKTIKEDQVYLYRKLQDMDELYLRNTAAILRLGFCPCLVHQQTSPVGELLMKIHRKLRVWDKKMEDICNVLKEPSTRKTTTAVLQILKISDNSKLVPDQTNLSDIELPEIVWDLDNPYLEQLNTPKLTEDWRKVRQEVRESLCKAEMEFQEVCLEFGITRGPEQIPPESETRQQYTYENKSMSHDSDEVSNNEQFITGNELDGDRDESSDDAPNSKVSSSFL